ncbi:Cytochrome P450 [Mycena venus]|uniref:Cytochrome P450 n=1 Tax=Mycena venus TaxID=2733690 RepID=A0A8H7CP89_9AGAR|nr:Cytochrome P450 [Mycena venus]
MFMASSLDALLTASVFLLLCVLYLLRRANRPPLPPGPRGLPFGIGNMFDLPKHSPWHGYAQMGERWGDLVSITTFGKTMIIVNSLKVAEDLLESRGGNFSDRPVIPMGGELVGFKNVITLCQYDDRVRKERKLFHQLFGTSKVIERFLSLLRSEIRKLLQNLLLNPPLTTGAIVLRIAYGYSIREGSDRFLELFDLRAKIFARSTQPRAFLVNLLPFLRYWPSWLPGGKFRTIAAKWAKTIQDSVDVPHEYVKEQMASGTAEHSFTSALLQEQPNEDYLIKWAASAILAGGSTTSSSQLEAFFLAMILYPDVQAEAQRELDQVVGKERLPDISDRPHLPYMNALCKEVLRWHTTVPLGFPHRTREDFIYERKGGNPPVLIPKNSIIVPNMWYMAHDPKVYSDPMTFNPGRFLASDSKQAELDPSKTCFGFGRRICAGKLFADTSLFLTCSMILSVFDINKVYKNGLAVEPTLGQTNGTISQPLPFECTVIPRSDQTRALIESTRAAS